VEPALNPPQAPPGGAPAPPPHPQQAGRWPAVITASYAQLVLARPLAAGQRLPGNAPATAPTSPPAGYAATFPGFARCSPRQPAPGNPAPRTRPKGSTTGPAQRYPAIKKAAQQPPAEG